MVIHATPFFWGTIFLFITTIFFYIGCVSLLYYWHDKDTTFVIVPLMFTFEFFTIGFFIIALICIALQYFPDVASLVGSL